MPKNSIDTSNAPYGINSDFPFNQPVVDNKDVSDKIAADKLDVPILTVAEVAAMLRVHRSTISRLAKSGELKSYLLGNRRLFRSDDVWSFFENQVASESVSGKG